MAKEESTEDLDTTNEVPQETASESKPKKINISTPSFLEKFKAWYLANKKLSLPLTGLFIILVLMVIPFTRYAVAGVFIKKDVSIVVTDSKTGGVVSSAEVELSGKHVETDGQGVALFKSQPVGKYTAKIGKKYYKTAETNFTVGLSGSTKFSVKTTATGRLTNVHVSNVIDGKVLAEVDIDAGDASAKTDSHGDAVLVLPAGTTTKNVTLKLDGYNDGSATVKVSDKEVLENSLSLSPVGKIYFLSKLSGKIDLVKTNLDGTDRKTVFAGTGKEEDNSTVLLASRDWKYLALLSRHDSDLPKLYLVETATDKVTVMDEGNASFSLVGWDDNSFIYQVTRNAYNDWQSKKYVIKGFNAESKQITALDQNDASGTSGQYIEEQIGNVYSLADGTIIYSKVWYNYPYGTISSLDGKQNSIYSIRSDGSGKKTLKNMDAKTSGYISGTPSKPNEMYFNYYDSSASKTVYLEYVDGAVAGVDADDYPENGVYNTYLLSPSGKQTFWSEQRDGKSTLLIGDAGGNGGKVIAKLTDYQTYGWYTGDYLLVSKNSSELYILPAAELSAEQKPVKISDYHKPSQNYYGYGGGYGGI
jgi:hypothetical protein